MGRIENPIDKSLSKDKDRKTVTEKMYHLKISIPSFRQIQTVRTDKEKALKENQGGEHGNNASSSSSVSKGHFVYNIEVGFLGERSQDVQEQRMARFSFN